MLNNYERVYATQIRQRCLVNSGQFSTRQLDKNEPRADKFSSEGKVTRGEYARGILLRSFTIQSSFNYRGMQNLGFAFSLLPLANLWGGKREGLIFFLRRHLQLFNTHPYMSAPILGAVARAEEANIESVQNSAEAEHLKNALMAPYAALGDSFFWGALKPFASVFSVLLALKAFLLAPFAFLILYNPSHLWIRIRGFIEGYNRGKESVGFIKLLDLPRLTAKIRWASLAGLACMAALISHYIETSALGLPVLFLTKVILLSLVLLCYWGIRKGISQMMMLYTMFIMSFLWSL